MNRRQRRARASRSRHQGRWVKPAWPWFFNPFGDGTFVSADVYHFRLVERAARPAAAAAPASRSS